MSSSISESRRRMLWALGVLPALVSTPTWAQTAPSLDLSGFGAEGESDANKPSAPAPALPYRMASPEQAPFRHAVAELFEWTCPFCRQINDGALQWGRSLPKGWVFVQVPVFSDSAGLRLAALFAAIQQVAGTRLAAFDDAMFSMVQDKNADPNNPETLIHAAEIAGIDPRKFQQDNSAAGLRKTSLEWINLLQAARPRVTPTFVVGGRFVTDVTMTAQRYDLLFQLLGGLVSQEVSRG